MILFTARCQGRPLGSASASPRNSRRLSPVFPEVLNRKKSGPEVVTFSVGRAIPVNTLHVIRQATIARRKPLRNRVSVACGMSLVLWAVALSSCWHSTGDEEPRFEARGWLLENRNPCAFAGNRFETTAAALRFVNRLIAAGADSVFVTGVDTDARRLETAGGPYADALVVVLPADAAPREVLFQMINLEAARGGFATERDEGQRELLLWWDEGVRSPTVGRQ